MQSTTSTLAVTTQSLDATFSSMTVDWAPSFGVMNPNHYLAVAIDYLLSIVLGWSLDAPVGKAGVSSAIIDRILQQHGQRSSEVQVGTEMNWFAPVCSVVVTLWIGKRAPKLSAAGQWRLDDKDGLITGLLGASIAARTAKHPDERYKALSPTLSKPLCEHFDMPATAKQAGLAG